MISARLRGYISAELAEKRKKSISLAWDRIGPLPYDEILQGSSFSLTVDGSSMPEECHWVIAYAQRYITLVKYTTVSKCKNRALRSQLANPNRCLRTVPRELVCSYILYSSLML